MTPQERENLKRFLPTYLTGKGIDITKYFNCINPEHNDVHPSMHYDEKRNKVHCFSCGCTYDLYDSIFILESFKEQKEAFQYAEKVYGNSKMSESDTGFKNSVKEISKPTTYPLTGMWLDYIKQRGISEETATRFNLSAGKCLEVCKNLIWDCIVIPVGENSYVFRNLNDNGNSKMRVRKRGSSVLFNKEALLSNTVFVVEGEFDALSIEEVGGSAVALGSTSNYRQLLSTLNTLDKKPFLVLCLDNDKEGQKVSDILSCELTSMDISFVSHNLYGEYKDANEALVKDREQFSEAVKSIISLENEISASKKRLYAKNSALNVLDFIKSEDCIATGFKNLDRVLDGGLYNELYVIGGGSSVGKTSFVLQMADQIAQHHEVLLFSFEMSKKSLVSKSLSRLSFTGMDERISVTARQVTSKNAVLTTKQKDSLEKAVEKYRKIGQNIYIVEGVTTTLREVISSINEHIEFTGNKPVVFIDYLQLLESDNAKSTDKQNMDKCIKELKRVGRELEIPIVAISSFSRSGYREEASMESFKESGSIEYSSDVLLALQFSGIQNKNFRINEEKKKDIRDVEVVVLKNRNGMTGERVGFDYFAKYNAFKEN